MNKEPACFYKNPCGRGEFIHTRHELKCFPKLITYLYFQNRASLPVGDLPRCGWENKVWVKIKIQVCPNGHVYYD